MAEWLVGDCLLVRQNRILSPINLYVFFVIYVNKCKHSYAYLAQNLLEFSNLITDVRLLFSWNHNSLLRIFICNFICGIFVFFTSLDIQAIFFLLHFLSFTCLSLLVFYYSLCRKMENGRKEKSTSFRS